MRVKRMIDEHFLPTNLYNKLETIARNGKVDLINKAIEYVRSLNESRVKPIFTNRHKFWKLAELANQSISNRQKKRTKKMWKYFLMVAG